MYTEKWEKCETQDMTKVRLKPVTTAHICPENNMPHHWQTHAFLSLCP